MIELIRLLKKFGIEVNGFAGKAERKTADEYVGLVSGSSGSALCGCMEPGSAG